MTEQTTPPERAGWRVREWAKRYGFSHELAYRMIRQGRGPRTVRVNDFLFITREDDDDWRRSLPGKDPGGRAA